MRITSDVLWISELDNDPTKSEPHEDCTTRHEHSNAGYNEKKKKNK